MAKMLSKIINTSNDGGEKYSIYLKWSVVFGVRGAEEKGVYIVNGELEAVEEIN